MQSDDFPSHLPDCPVCNAEYNELMTIRRYLETYRAKYDDTKTICENMIDFIAHLTKNLDKFTSSDRLDAFESLCRIHTLAAELKATTTVEEYMCKMVDLVREITPRS